MSERLSQLVNEELKKKRLQEASIFMLTSLLLLSIEHNVVDEELNDIVRKNLMPDVEAATTDWDKVRDECLLEGASIYVLAKLLLMQTEKPNAQMFPGLKEEVEKRLKHRQETHGHL